MDLERGWEGPQIEIAGIAAIPATPTVVSTTRTKVKAVFVSNPSVGSITVTIRSGDGSGTPVGVLVVASNGQAVWPTGLLAGCDGILFPSGISWGASGAGAFGEIIGTKCTV